MTIYRAMFTLPPQTRTPLEPIGFSIPSKEYLVKQYVGKKLHEVRTPRMIVDRAITIEATEIQLDFSKTDAIVVSTLAEAYYVVNSHLVTSGKLKDVLFGFPVSPDRFDDVYCLSQKVEKFCIFIDHSQTLDALEVYCEQKFKGQPPCKLNVYMKVECGYGRAGAAIYNDESLNLAQRLISSSILNVIGLYTHAGHSYDSRSIDVAVDYLKSERDAALRYKNYLLEKGVHFEDISIGATPTVMAARYVDQSELNGITEIHAGSFVFNDRQQLATQLPDKSNVAVTVLCRVASRYPERGSLLMDGGALGFSKDTAPQGGYGTVVGKPSWKIVKLAQEHSVVTDVSADDFQHVNVGDVFRVIPNHSCLTAACYEFFLVIEENGDEIVDVWVPVKGW
ncbi:D-serine dehydratase [Pseudolycoriella hygida]|uniref:D-serine dehydratase n=1 Tax=Pseudolycoriella hygida TaxID=35572 RepID=A0A9Q0MMI3_9DIPT|nr:D-serine dehydratase [Pseudolycoriella hygida]